MKKRIISAVIMLIVIVPLIYFGGHVFNIGVLLITALAYKEIINLKWFKDLPLFVKILGFISLISTAITGNYITNEVNYFYILVPLVVTYIASSSYKAKKYTTKEIMYLLLMILLIGFGFNSIMHIRNELSVFVFVILICVLSDTFAMFTGCLIGKHKLCPKISPKKTIEGSIGGLVVSTVLSLTYYYFFVDESITIWLVLGTILLVMVSQLGDLLFSKIKRENKIKDFSSLIPGHGGILDRLDSILCTSFVFFAYILSVTTGAGSVILLILILGFIILIHELGHFMWAKIFKVYIHEFSIGMGPILLSKTGKDGVDYNVRAIPIGGFVAMAGEVYEDDEENKIPKDKFMCNKKWWQRIIILVAGVTYNFILAIIILFLISFIWKTPNLVPVVDNAAEGLPMHQAGVMPGDEIVEINGYKINSWDVAQIILYMEDEDGIYDFVVSRDGENITFNVEPDLVENENGSETRVFGINIKTETPKTFWDSIIYSFERFGTIVESMGYTLYGLFSGKIGLDSLAGPIGMYEAVDQSAEAGLVSTLSLVALLSINVGFLNILPFPAFDGGRILFILIEKIKGSPINSKIENMFHFIGFILLMILTVYVAIQDIIRLS